MTSVEGRNLQFICIARLEFNGKTQIVNWLQNITSSRKQFNSSAPLTSIITIIGRVWEPTSLSRRVRNSSEVPFANPKAENGGCCNLNDVVAIFAFVNIAISGGDLWIAVMKLVTNEPKNSPEFPRVTEAATHEHSCKMNAVCTNVIVPCFSPNVR